MESESHDRFPELPTEHTPSDTVTAAPEAGADVTNKRHSAVSPPYWNHKRTASSATQSSLQRPPPISLEDNTDPTSPTLNTLWAKSIAIDDYVIVNGNPTGIGAYVVWNCTVQTLDGGPMTIRKRYSEFVDLRHRLAKNFPQSTKKSLPALPPKSAFYKFRPAFLEKRRQGLAYFLTCVMLNPEYASSDAVKDFIFGYL
jgi:hypothetical protein